jgi:hypothetical protein
MKLFSILKKILLWSYDRGTWQYDVLCILILAFIFLTPSQCFQGRSSSLAWQAQHKNQAIETTAPQPSVPVEASKPGEHEKRAEEKGTKP